jgi:hypothetical protein
LKILAGQVEGNLDKEIAYRRFYRTLYWGRKIDRGAFKVSHLYSFSIFYKTEAHKILSESNIIYPRIKHVHFVY